MKREFELDQDYAMVSYDPHQQQQTCGAVVVKGDNRVVKKYRSGPSHRSSSHPEETTGTSEHNGALVPVDPNQFIMTLQQTVPNYINAVTGLEHYPQFMAQSKEAPLQFPFFQVQQTPVPIQFFHRAALLGIVGDEPSNTTELTAGPLAPYTKELKEIAQHVQFSLPGAGQSITLANLNTSSEVLSQGLKRVAETFKNHTLNGSESFINCFMNGLLATQQRTGLLLNSKELVQSVDALAKGTGHQPPPPHIAEDLRRRLETLKKEQLGMSFSFLFLFFIN